VSIKIMSEIWEYSQHKGSALLLLLAIGDFANDERRVAWPSYETLSTKCRCTKRHVISLIAQLESSGELLVERHRGRGHSNSYMVKRFHPLPEMGESEGRKGEPQFTNIAGETVNPSSPIPAPKGELCAQKVNFDALKGEPQFTRSITNHHMNRIGDMDRERDGESAFFAMHLKQSTTQANWDSYLSRLLLKEVSPERIVLVAPNEMAREWCDKRLRPILEDAAKAISADGHSQEVVIMC
jgi:hypothetical protein